MKGTVRPVTAFAWLIPVAIAVLLIAALPACAAQQPGPAEKGAPAPSKDLAEQQILVLGFDATDLSPVDPARASTSDAWFYVTSAGNGLVRYPPGAVDVTKLQPDLAERWEVSQDGLVWTFSLRKGVQFHKGFGEFTAQDVKFSYERFSDPQVKAAYGRPNIKQIDVVDPYTVRIALKQPDAFFLNDVSNWNGGWIVSKKAVEQMGLEAFSRSPVLTGPFQFGAYVPKESLTLDANKSYFRGTPILEKIVIKFMGADQNVRALALRNGDIHGTRNMNKPELINALEKDGFKRTGRWGNRYFLNFKLTEKPFDDLRVRQAIAYGIDRKAFEVTTSGDFKPLYSHLAPPQAFSLKKEEIPDELRYEYSPDKARKLLAEAGHPNGFSAKIVVPETVFLDTMLVVQDQVKKIGLNLDYQIVDWSKWLATTRQGTNGIEIWSSLEATPDQAFRDYFHSATIVGKTGGVRNWSHYGETGGSIDAKLDQAKTTGDAETQKRLYREIELQLLRDLPYMPLHYAAIPRNITAPNVDLGYSFENSLLQDAPIVETTRLLKK